MTTADLQARGFTQWSQRGWDYAFCLGCHNFSWFAWWSEPGHMGIKVAACTVCGTLEPGGDRYVERFPILPIARTP